jgi:hypothetical protein
VPMHKWHKYIDRFNVFGGGKFKACHIFSMSSDNKFEFVALGDERLPMVPTILTKYWIFLLVLASCFLCG